jgi:hypothetical protein
MSKDFIISIFAAATAVVCIGVVMSWQSFSPNTTDETPNGGGRLKLSDLSTQQN